MSSERASFAGRRISLQSQTRGCAKQEEFLLILGHNDLANDSSQVAPRRQGHYLNFAYSALACVRMGMSESASSQSLRKSL
jgi:hypothetical protein